MVSSREGVLLCRVSSKMKIRLASRQVLSPPSSLLLFSFCYSLCTAKLLLWSAVYLLFFQINHLEASNTVNAQSNVWDENLAFLRWSAVCLLFSKSHLDSSNTKAAQRKDVWIEYLESNYILCGLSLREFPLLF